jgi:hypothetical protein
MALGIPSEPSSFCASGVTAPTHTLADYVDFGKVSALFAVLAAEIIAVDRAMAFLVTAFSAHPSPPGN